MIIIFLASSGLLGLGVNYYKKAAHRIDLRVVPSGISKEETVIDTLIKESKQVNINASNIEGFTRLPGIGPKLAREIVDYRNLNGAFAAIEDIQNVAGIGPKKFERIKELLVLE